MANVSPTRKSNPRATAAEDFPLSPMQEAIWFLQRLAPQGAAYNVAFAARLPSAADAEALDRALAGLVAHHAALRTTFGERAGRPFQREGPPPASVLSAVDAAGWSAGELLARVTEEANRPFDLTGGSALRAHLYRGGAGGPVLLLTLHHLVIDGHSFWRLIEELGWRHQAEAAGTLVPELPSPGRYADFVAWQAARLAGPEGERLRRFQAQLRGVPALAPPTDRPRRGTALAPPGRTVRFLLGRTATAALRALAAAQRTTLYTLVLAAFETLLLRWSGQEEFLLGTAVQGRGRRHFAAVLGCFFNVVPLVARTDPEEPFDAHLRRVHASVRSALVHQDQPSHRLADELGLRPSGGAGLFPAVLVWQQPRWLDGASALTLDETGWRLRVHGLDLEPLPVERRFARQELELEVIEAGETLAAAVHVDADLLTAETAARLAGHLKNLLAAIVATPTAALAALPMLSAAEERQLREDLHRAEPPWARPVAVHDLIAEQAARHPDATAAVDADGSLTYRELAERSRLLAAHVHTLLDRPGRAAGERRIGLLADPDAQTLIGWLGLLTAGAGFVPIDPRFPDDRVAWMLEDGACPLLLAGRRHLARAADLARRVPGPCRVLGLDDVPADAGPAEAPRHLDAVAYVVYTSGSTGRPKGVAVSHANLVPTLRWGCAALGLGAGSRVLQNLSFCFDFGLFEQMTTLLAGGTLVFPGEAAAEPERCAREIRRHGIDTLHTTPAFARELAAVGGPLESLVAVHLGGEALAWDTVERLRRAAPRATFWNGYGPTEATINSTLFRIDGTGEEPGGGVPIGRRSADHALYVLDRTARLVPPGAPGELHVGGPGVARGYLNRPELTAERFVPDPFTTRPGGRLYRTGDRVRRRPGGDLEFLGRLDRQVKVRGFRVEPGEIEAALRAHPAVREAAVAARPQASGDLRLVAWVVLDPADGLPAPAAALRAFLTHRLPPSLVPAAFVVLAELPRTPNGKLDRRALPEPAGRERAAAAAPRTPAEELVAGICADVLGLDGLGREEDLFELGCHSLPATRIVARVREALQVDLPLRSLFDTPTVAGLTAAAAAAATGRGLPPLVPAPRDGDLPLSFPQERIWFLHKLEPASVAYHVPRALAVHGALDVGRLARVFTEIVRRHEILRTTFEERGAGPVQIVHPPWSFPVPLIDLQAVPAARRAAWVARLLLDEGRTPFDLGCGPLIRVKVLRLAAAEHVLVTTEHHLVHDGWTQGVLIRDFLALYAAFARGAASPLPALPVQYADFAVWQRRWLQGALLERQLAFWQGELAGAPALSGVPPDRPRPQRRSAEGGLVTRPIPADLANGLRALSRRLGTTLFMTLLAVFATLLRRSGAGEDLPVGTVLANRRVQEIEGLLGMILNTLVLRVRLEGEPRLDALARRVRETCLRAYEHQDAPVEKLVEVLQPVRSLSYTPLFQVLFSFLDTPTSELTLPGLELRLLDAHNGSAKFDLNVTVIPHSEQRVGGGVHQAGDEIALMWEYSTDLYEPARIERLTRHYLRLLAGAVAAPGDRISELPLLDDAERHQLAVEWGGTAGEPAAAPTLHRWLTAQARRTPDAAALTWGEETLTYGALLHRAQQLAGRLRRRGVGPESRVGLCLERSPELVVGLLGILLAGGAYVPLDPGLPRERLEALLDDAAVGLVVTAGAGAAALPDPVERIPITADGEFPDDVPDPVDGTCAAYVIYTSGSTGRPKGTPVTHGNVARLLTATQGWLGFTARDVWTLFHSFAFDFSVWEIWGALLHGGRLVIVPWETSRSPGRFLDLLAREQVTVLNQTPSAFAQLVTADAARAAAPTALRWVIFGGEALDPAVLVPWWERHGETRPTLVNMYGITETTVHVTFRPLRAADARARRSVLGAPLPDLSLAVLDPAWLRPMPIGAPGEIVVGGAGLARGYLGRPALTAERFIPDPSGGRPGARLYRSGDRGRFLPDGDLEYLGRIDRQVKIRGFRIEPGEIEAALLELDGVRAAVVVVREEPGGDRRLVAYVVGEVAAETLRAALAGRLPDYMVPAALVPLAALPLTRNGKVDLQALPAPGPTGAGAGFTPPRTPVEELLAGLWEEVLGLPAGERVGADSHFFALGGHSLLAARVAARLRSTCGVELPLRTLFEAPVLADLATQVEAARRDGTAPAPPPVPVPREGPLPLSFAQQRLWFLDQLEPGSPRYNIPMVLAIDGPLDAARLEHSLGAVVRRHEALRTVFAVQNGEPVQVIQPPAPFPLPVVDLAGLPGLSDRTDPTDPTDPTDDPQARQARHLAHQEARRPFDLARGPLLRGVLLRRAADRHVLALTLHHIAGDGWSLGVLLREVRAFHAGETLPALPVQAADVAVWQRAWLQGEVLERELAWWRRQLAGLPPLLELPTDRPRPAVRSSRGAARPVRLPEGLTRPMQSLARREGATLFMVLLAGFQALLARTGGQADLAVGTPVAGRNRVETEGLIGFFVNTLVLRGDLSGAPAWRALLGRVRETALAAHAHQELPFEKLVQELAPERSLAQAPLVQVLLALQNATAEGLEVPGLRLRRLPAPVTTAKLDLTLSLTEHDGELHGAIEYATDLWDGATIDRLAGHFERLLTAMTEAPEQRIGEASLLSPEEARQLEAWNATPAEEPAAPVHELFFRQAEQAPDAVAVTGRDAALTRGALARRARALAGRLRRQGVLPGHRVGLCTERSPEMVVGMLAILAAGGAYVPLDPAHPQDRLAFLLDDTGVRVVVATEGLAGRLPAHPGRRVEILEAAIEPGDPPAPPPLSAPDDPAYVLFTSGSTGRPKGVVVPHRAIVRLVCATDYVRLGPEDRMAQVASPSFDAATFEIWGALLNGGRLAVLDRAATLAPAELIAALRREGVTALFLTTALFHLVARDAVVLETTAGFAPLRHLLFGGEAVDPAAVRAVLAAGPPERLLHVYGPTEATTFATWHRVEVVPPEATTVPIGRPLAHRSLHVLDAGGLQQPVGLTGELHLGGAGLAHGYHARPELTAERFVPDPFASLPGARLYRTGDLVRRRPDGAVEFLGRLDHQVKIRGFRIEPGEIEAALLALPGVREAVVVARHEPPDDRRLVAYVVGDAAPGALRAALRERLPDFLVPAAFVALAALPLNAHGKVDRRALPAPERRRTAAGGRPPRTPVEEVLAAHWADLLGLEQVDATDHFFELGGHSLLATQVMSRLRSAFGVELPLRDLFEAPVLADLATRIETARRTGTPAPPPLRPVPREGPLPLSFAQQRLWFLAQLEPASPLSNIAAALAITGPLDAARLARSLGEVMRRHEALRTVFAAPEGTPEQLVQPATPFFLPVVDLAGLPGLSDRTDRSDRSDPSDLQARQARLAHLLAREEALRPFDLARGPLLRGVLLRRAADDHVLALTLHHIAGDGWSMGLLVREVQAFHAGAALAELPVQYPDFAVWQRAWLQGEVLAGEIAWWRRELAGLPPLLALPTDRPRPAVQSLRAASRPLRLPAGLSRRMQTLGRRDGATLFMVLLAGFQVLLARMGGQADLAVGSPVAGRNREEIEGLIGCFVNTLVLRAPLEGAATFADFLARVRRTTLDAYAHQDLPFERLVEELAPERSLAHAPLFQASLVLQNTPPAPLEMPGLCIEHLPGAPSRTAYDLDLTLTEGTDGLAGALTWAADLFDPPTMERLAGHLTGLLAAATEQPDRPLAELPLLAAAERHQLLVEWSGAAVPETPLVPALLAAQVERTPDAIAVACGRGGALSYRELARQVNALAQSLRRRGVGPEVVVGLCVERSPAFLVGLLGVLAAGGLYVPLDPALPAERLAFLEKDCGAALRLTREHLEGIDPTEETDRTDPLDPDQAAYALYTSGSTGQPKGAVISHRALASFAVGLIARLGLRADDRVLQVAAVGFDVTLEEIVPPLLAGGCVVLRDPQELATLHGLQRALAEEAVTTVELPTAVWHDWVLELERSGERPPAGLRRVLTGSERVLPERVDAWRRLGVPLVHVFGLTEVTVTSLLHVVPPEEDAAPGPPPVGRPFGGTRAWLLDAALGAVPIGVAGELYLGGPGVARGYLGRPGWTAERFLPDPFCGTPGARMYRTGDRLRRRPDGTLDFLGRLDRQVKIRGIRIEPGEIEAALSALPGVGQAVVVLREDRLVAYVTGGAAVETLRAALRERLPEHLVPAAFVPLAALPLTANGKVDRQALPAPERPGAAAGFVAPRTPTEEVLAGLWAELLGVERVGAADHFFDLGGHSLLATRVVSRLRTTFGVEMPLRDLFEAPVLADLAARIEAARRAGTIPTAPPLVRVPREGPLPLSFAQQRLWFLDQLEPGSPLYNVPVALQVTGPLDAGRLARALGEVVRRHEALRTVFAAPDGAPVQVIRPASTFVLPIVDLSGLPGLSDPTDRSDRSDPSDLLARQARQARRLAREEAGRPFDLARDPLLRGLLLRRSADDHLFALTLHHIASDGWSMGLLVREVQASYAGAALPEPPVQYADFAAWQRAWLQGEVLAGEIAWWRRQLAGLPPLLTLPTDRPRPAVQSHRGATRPLRLPAALTRSAAALARRDGATLFMVLLAGFQALLARLGGQEDLAVGSPVAGRNRTEVEGLIGFFVNTLVLRGDLSGAPTLHELLRRVRATALDAWLHQDVPFEKLVEELAPERSLAQSPLFQVMLILQNAPVESLELGDLHLRLVEGSGTTAKFDLLVSLEEHGGTLAGAVEFATDLFDAATIDRLSGHLTTLLGGLLAEPERPVDEIGLLTAAEVSELRAWNETATAFPAGRPLHAWIEDQVDRTPFAPAVVCGGEVLSYRELDRRANRLARRLRALAVGPEARVAVCLEPAAQVVALLAVLKAGGAYVPLDPEHPRERLATVLADAQPAVLLASGPLLDRLPAPPVPPVPVIRLDARRAEEAEAADAAGDDRLPDGGGDLRLAYLIYTSGSTGQPKGVAVPHRALVRFLFALRDRLGIGAADRLLALTPLSFDIAALEHYLPLLVGATVEPVDRETARDGDRLRARLQAARPTFVQATPSTWRMLVHAGWPGAPDLTVLCGGEPLPEDLARDLTARARAVWNLYGPTETTVWSMAEPLAGPEPRVTLGRPIANTAIHLLDRHLAPVPVGVAAELFIGGDGVARGYPGRPEQTAERFLPDPFATEQPGRRLYRTGDLARRLPDGRVEFLGRLDHQVKIRGFRIELGEIEAALTALPGIREAVVVARSDETPGDRRLVAYVVGDTGTATLRQALQQRLPGSMIPATFVELAALPLTPNGKVDRKALPAPERQPAAAGDTSPRTPTEHILAGLWAELLRVERVGLHEDFFALGGHSLLATQVLSRVRSLFTVELSVRALFEAPTVAGLAARIETAWRAGASPTAPPLVPMPRRGPLPLSFAQQRLWFLDQLEPGSPLYHLPLALHIEGPLDAARLARSLGEVVRRHETLRTVFAVHAGKPVQVIRPAEPFLLPVVDLAGLPGTSDRTDPSNPSDPSDLPARQALRLAQEEADRPFDLARDPLLRGVLLRRSPEDHVLALTLHHIAGDGWSIGVLVREMRAAYAGESLAEPPVQFADFAIWQNAWLQGEVLAGELAWWRRQLAGLPPLLELPTDRPRPARQSYRGTLRPVRLPAGLTAQAQAFARREGATLFMVLLAAFQALLARCGGQEDLAVGTPVAGRNRVEIENLIGFFVNTLVLRGDLRGEPSFSTLLARVRETALAAYLHQDLPFEKLVEELAPQRSLAHTPLFQVMLVLQNAPVESLEIRDLRLHPLGTAGTTAKFDLTLSLEERDGALVGTLEAAGDLFDTPTIDRLVLHYERWLTAALAAPEARLGEPALLGEGERQQLLIEWNDTDAPAAPELSLHALFAAQVAQTPDAAAVTCAGATLTYGGLAARVRRLAHHLRGLGGPPEPRIGVALERGLDLPVAFLAVLEAGAVYVPFDPLEPRERLAFLLESARPTAVLTRESLPALHAGAPEPGEPRGGDDLAYVLHTSGSTGRPKGAMVTHRGLLNHLCAKIADLGLAPHSRVAQTASPCFDISIWQLLAPLLAGGTVEIVPDATVQDPDLLLRAVDRQQITVLEIVPSLLQGLLAVAEAPGRRPALSSLQWMIVTGEACAPDLATRWLRLAPHTRLLNAYGPTECADDVTHYRMDPRLDRPEVHPLPALPLGRPLANTRLYVLDRWHRPAPPGVAGELCVAGHGVGRGYLGLPERTAEVFVPDALSREPGARLYRTGDRARWRVDGTLEFLGRLDHQVKVRGFRIEPGEIEAALRAIPGVHQAVVVAREDGAGRRLVAYVVGDAAIEALRGHLRERLPAALLPAAFVRLAALPLTPNGKVDRQALPAPDAPAGAGQTAPRTAAEALLAGLWAEVLGLGQVGADGHFFDLGGHSLLAVHLVARIEHVFGVKLPIAALFEAPTVEQLAALIQGGPVRRSTPRVLLHPGGAGRPLFIVHPVGGDVFSYAELARRLGPERPVYGLQALAEDGASSPRMEDLAARHLAAVREVQPEGPWLLAGWSFGAVLAYEMARQIESAGGAARLVLIDPPPPPDGSGADPDDAALLAAFAALGRPAGEVHEEAALRETLRGLDREAGLAHLLARGRAEGVLAEAVDPAWLRERFALFRRHMHALRGYLARPCGGRVTLFRAGASEAADRTAGWGALARVETHLLADADHLTILQPPALDRVIEGLQSAAAESLQPAPGGRSLR